MLGKFTRILVKHIIQKKEDEDMENEIKRRGLAVTLGYTNEFVDFWESLKEKYPEEIFRIQGVHNDNFDISKFSKNFFKKSASVASVSVDANANVKEKSIAQYIQEYPKGLQRLNSFYQLFKWVKKVWGVKYAKIAVEKVLNGELAINDFSNFSTSYCYAFDLRMLLMEGMNFFKGGMKINAPKRSDSFVALLIQTTAFISNQIMGACSYPDCFVAWDWFLRNEHGQDYMKRIRAGEDDVAKKKILDQFQNLIYSFNFPFRSSQSAFTNLSVMDKGYMKSLFGEYWLPDGTLADLDSSQELSKLFFEYFNSINGKEGMFTFPVMTLSISLDQDGNYIDPDFKKWASKYNCTKSFSNVFIGEPDIYSSCCRLSNNIKKAGGLGFQNSFGVGGLSLGSHRVAVLNLARISLLEKDNPDILEEDIEMLHKILYAHRKLIKEKISKGVMPLYTSEWISINRQYSTIGITACNQYVANKGLDIKTQEGIDCIYRVLKAIETNIEKWQAEEAEESCIYNLEAIPAESMAVRLAQTDRLLGYNDKYEIYSNQYIDLMEDCPIYERFKVQGQLDQLTSGGNILHCNIDGEKPLTPEQYEKIIDLAKDCKVKYFGINYAYSECAKRHYTIGKNKKCPICGEPIVETWCRVVGFITPKSAFNPVRRDFEFDRRVFYEADKVDEATNKELANANC